MRDEVNNRGLFAELLLVMALVGVVLSRASGAEAVDLSRVPQLKETAEQRDARMQWWRDANLLLNVGPMPTGEIEARQASGTRSSRC